jgi:hypothetical protein
VLFVLSGLWMCVVFLALLHYIVFPSEDLQGIVHALQQQGPAPVAAESMVQETIAAVGPLIRALPVAFYSGGTATIRSGRSKTSSKKQASYVAWFQKRSKPLLLLVTCIEDDEGRKSFRIEEGEPIFLIRGYTLPVLAFGTMLFLVLRTRSSSSVTAVNAQPSRP